MHLVDDEKLYVYVGTRIREARSQAHPKISQAKLAAMLKVERTSITNIENGNQRPSIYVIYEICSILNLSISDLLPPISEVLNPRRPGAVDERAELPLTRSTADRLKEELKRR